MDIVDRLRQRIGLVKFDSDAIALRDAANEIEQLRELEARYWEFASKYDSLLVEIERLRTNQSIIIALFRIYMIRLNPDYSEEEFDKHIANMLEEKE